MIGKKEIHQLVEEIQGEMKVKIVLYALILSSYLC